MRGAQRTQQELKWVGNWKVRTNVLRDSEGARVIPMFLRGLA